MIRSAPRLILRHAPQTIRPPASRFISTAPPAKKSRSWKSSAVRWSLAIGAIYYYNTSHLFAEEASFPIAAPPIPSESTLPTLDTIRPSRLQETSPPSPSSPPQTSPPPSPSLEETEEEATQQGAFNEETGEINWDCPCLGGMAHGPCGEQFRAAFSCFVYSKEEPKGMECIDHFKTMQTCFRDHPDVYGAELEEEEEGEEGEEAYAASASSPPQPETAAPVPTTAATASPPIEPSSPSPSLASTPPSTPSTAETRTQRATAAKEQVAREHGEPTSESAELVPKAAHDAR